MSEPTYIEQLRAIRDRIGEQLQQMTWQEWDAQAREKVRRDAELGRLLDDAEVSVGAGTHASSQER